MGASWVALVAHDMGLHFHPFPSFRFTKLRSSASRKRKVSGGSAWLRPRLMRRKLSTRLPPIVEVEEVDLGIRLHILVSQTGSYVQDIPKLYIPSD